MISLQNFTACLPHASKENITKFYGPLSSAMEKYEINTPRRQAAFLAQIAHESGSLHYLEELASGDAYDTRTDLGNTPERDGDGRRYKGRGLIQITGKANYEALGKALGWDFVNNPEDLEKPGAASISACWFWDEHNLNRLADIDAFEKITRAINGGINGLEDRKKNWEICRRVLKVEI